MHIFYDLKGNLVNDDYEVEKKTAANKVLTNIWGKLVEKTDFQLHVNEQVTQKITGSYGWKIP